MSPASSSCPPERCARARRYAPKDATRADFSEVDLRLGPSPAGVTSHQPSHYCHQEELAHESLEPTIYVGSFLDDLGS